MERLNIDLESKTNIDLQFKYCHPRYVNGKRQKQQIFKAKYLAKQRHLKAKGDLQTSLHKLDQFLETNIDFLWERYCPDHKELGIKLDRERRKQFKETLAEKMESKLNRKFLSRRHKQIMAIKKRIDPKIDY